MVTRKTFGVAVAVALAVLVPLAVLRPVARAAAGGPVSQTRGGDVNPIARKVARGLFDVQGVRIRAQAYVDHEYRDTPFRCALGIVSAPAGSDQWGLTYTDYEGATYPDMNDMGTFPGGVFGNSVAKGDLVGRRATLRPHLHQYDIYDERVTFHDLDISRPKDGFAGGFGFLTLTRPLTATTPSGVTVTLPVQNADILTRNGFCYNGPGGVTFVCAVLTPDRARSVLPESPLYQRHHVPVSVDVMAAAPVFTNSRLDDPAQLYMTITPPGKDVTHLDSLTLIVHQRADLQDIPLTLPVPVDRQLAPPFYP